MAPRLVVALPLLLPRFMHEFDRHRQFLRLWKEALAGKPFVDQQGSLLSLCFDISAIQSQMDVNRPDDLVLPYTQLMMGLWLIHPQPQRLALVGLGGGSLVKFIHRHLPHTRLDVAEIHPDVIALREQFCVPPDDARLHVRLMDGAEMVRTIAPGLDALLLDGYSADGIPHALSTPAFFDHCRNVLGEHGLLVLNLSSDEHRGDVVLQRVRRCLPHTICVPSSDGANRVVFAARHPLWARPETELQTRAAEVLSASGLDLRPLVREWLMRKAPLNSKCEPIVSARTCESDRHTR